MEYVKTGIAGFDAATEGGIPKGTRTLLYGGPGTGKTVFAMQYLWTGLQEGNLVALNDQDRPIDFTRNYFRSFGWDLAPFEKGKKFFPLQSFGQDSEFPKEKIAKYLAPGDLAEWQTAARQLATKKIDRLVIGDISQTDFAELSSEWMTASNNWMLNWTYFNSITAIEIITATQVDVEGHKLWSKYLKAAQNIIQFRFQEGRREIRILKMEGTTHPLYWLPMEITANGIEVGVT